jgi:hypothetical protein
VLDFVDRVRVVCIGAGAEVFQFLRNPNLLGFPLGGLLKARSAVGETNSGGGGLYGSKANGTSPTSTMDEPKVALRIVEDSSRDEFPDTEEGRKDCSPGNRYLSEDGGSDVREE